MQYDVHVAEKDSGAEKTVRIGAFSPGEAEQIAKNRGYCVAGYAEPVGENPQRGDPWSSPGNPSPAAIIGVLAALCLLAGGATIIGQAMLAFSPGTAELMAFLLGLSLAWLGVFGLFWMDLRRMLRRASSS